MLALLPLALLGCQTEALTVPSWYADVQPMTERHCNRCHYPGGQGGLDFTDRDAVETMADVMLAAIDAGDMPPPASDPDCRDYEGSENLVLPAETRDRFAAWIQAGMPEGEPADAVAVEPIPMTLEDADMEVRLPEPYTPPFADANNPGNEYRCFALEHGRDEAFFITAMGPLVDEQDLVHHIVVYPLPANQVPSSYDPATGYDCINQTGQVEEMLAGWAPGSTPIELDEGLGIRIGPDDRIVIQMHYFQSGSEAKSDQSGYAFRTVDEVDTEVLLYPFGYWDFEIPAGDPAYTYTVDLEIPETINYGGTEIEMPDLVVYGTFPHMHVLGSGYDLRVTRPDGEEECGVSAERYSFDNQVTYMFEEPLVIEGGDTLHWSCTWNNSTSNPGLIHDPPVDVTYGERTDEEMCWAFTLLSYEF